MPLTNTQLRYYDSNVLRLPPDKRKGYHEQVDRLIEELSRSVRDKTETSTDHPSRESGFVCEVHDSAQDLRGPVDVDVVFYISGRSIDRETLQGLNDLIHDFDWLVWQTIHSNLGLRSCSTRICRMPPR